MRELKPAGITDMYRKKSKFRISAVLGLVIILLIGNNAQAQIWKPVSGEENLKALFSNTTMTWGNHERGEYCADGTGTIYAHSSTFPYNTSDFG